MSHPHLLNSRLRTSSIHTQLGLISEPRAMPPPSPYRMSPFLSPNPPPSPYVATAGLSANRKRRRMDRDESWGTLEPLEDTTPTPTTPTPTMTAPTALARRTSGSDHIAEVQSPLFGPASTHEWPTQPGGQSPSFSNDPPSPTRQPATPEQQPPSNPPVTQALPPPSAASVPAKPLTSVATVPLPAPAWQGASASTGPDGTAATNRAVASAPKFASMAAMSGYTLTGPTQTSGSGPPSGSLPSYNAPSYDAVSSSGNTTSQHHTWTSDSSV